MKRARIVLCAAFLIVGIVPSVSAQDSAPSPNVESEEPTSPLVALDAASAAVDGAVASSLPEVDEPPELGPDVAAELAALAAQAAAARAGEEEADEETLAEVSETVVEEPPSPQVDVVPPKKVVLKLAPVVAKTAPVDAAQDVAKRDERRVWNADDFKHTIEMFRQLRDTVDPAVETLAEIREKVTDPARANLMELAPYVAHPEWPQIVEKLYDDHCKDALKQFDEVVPEQDRRDNDALTYFRARIQMCSGDADEGRPILEKLAKQETAIGILAARRLGDDVIVTEGEGEEGMYLSQRIRKVKRSGKKDVDKAMRELDDLYREMSRRSDKNRVRLAQAQLLESAGRHDDAGQLYLALYRKTRGSRMNDDIEDRLEHLEKKTGKKYLTYGERIDRMRHLVARGKYSAAKEVSIENAKIRGVSGNEIRGWKYYREGLQAERDKDRKEAVALFEKAEKLVADTEVRPRLYFGWARALRRLDRDGEAIALYERLAKEYPSSHLVTEATYEAGRLLQFAGKHGEAVEKFERVAKDKDSEFVSDALWRLSFSYYLQGEWDAATAPLERLRAEFADERDESELTLGLKATYWLAMVKLRSGETDAARDMFQATIDRGMLTWYGRLAASRMEQNGWTPRVRLPNSTLSQSELRDLATLRVGKNPRLEVAGEFARLGLWKDALGEMRDQVSIHPVPDGAHRLLAAIYLANGHPNWAHWIMKKHIDEAGPTWATLRDWGTAFPLDYMDLSHEYGTRHHVSPFLVQAIIRQESGFRPRVASWAGAVGLMQLMPRTGAFVARYLPEPTKVRRSDLKDPRKNVELGSMYIRLHTAQAHDNIPLALAAYNAGGAPLESWIDRYGDRELDAFVESITYKEARGYVRKVFTSYVTYSALYGGELPDVSFDVPKKLRKFGDVPERKKTTASEPVSMR